MGPVHYDTVEAMEILSRNRYAVEELATGELQEALVALHDALDHIAALEEDEGDCFLDDHKAPYEAFI